MLEERKQPAQQSLYSASVSSATTFEPDDFATQTLAGWPLGLTAIVLAVAAVVAFSQSASNPAPARQATPAAVQRHPAATVEPILLLYLVETQEQYDLAFAADAQAGQERLSSGAREPNYTMLVINTST